MASPACIDTKVIKFFPASLHKDFSDIWLDSCKKLEYLPLSSARVDEVEVVYGAKITPWLQGLFAI